MRALVATVLVVGIEDSCARKLARLDCGRVWGMRVDHRKRISRRIRPGQAKKFIPHWSRENRIQESRGFWARAQVESVTKSELPDAMLNRR
jgi:hypothetical protein